MLSCLNHFSCFRQEKLKKKSYLKKPNVPTETKNISDSSFLRTREYGIFGKSLQAFMVTSV